MSWRPHGHVRVNSRQPSAAGICDRCGRPFNHVDLRWQFDWTGAKLQNLRILVCADCEDTPQEQLRARILSPDPVPIYNARPEPFYFSGVGQEQTAWITAEQNINPQGYGTTFTMEDGSTLITTEGTNTAVTTGGP